MKETVSLILATLALGISIYFGVPHIMPKRAELRPIEQLANPDQLRTLAKGKLSETLLEKTPTNDVITTPEIARIHGDIRIPAILPPGLIFPQTPKVREEDREKIAQAQRMALLENQVHALKIGLSLMRPSPAWTWEWGWDKLWALLIWVLGVIVSTLLKRKTESFLDQN
jgi:hypothetical protein